MTSMLASYIPPDFYGEQYNKEVGFWSNQGQVVDTDGNLRPDVEYYSIGSTPRLYMRNGKMSFVYNPAMPWDSTSIDTVYRADMYVLGRGAMGSPTPYVVKDHYENYYLDHCGPNGVTNVLGYSRIVYDDVYNLIDMHF